MARAEFVGNVSLTLSTHRCTLAGMKVRTVVIVAVPGLQSLDGVGPFEVLAGGARRHERARVAPDLHRRRFGVVAGERTSA